MSKGEGRDQRTFVRELISDAGILCALALVGGGIIEIVHTWPTFATWAQYHFGFRKGDGNSPHYLFWSGSGSDLTEFGAMIGFLGSCIILYRKHNCHEPWCPRLGHDTIDDRGTLSCWHHHPEGKRQRGHVARKHAEHKARLNID